MTVSFKLALRPTAEWGMNRVYAGQHWTARKKQAQEVHLLVRAAIRRQAPKARQFRAPVRVVLRYNSRLDIDNHGYLAKLIIDGMKGLLIEDDDRRHVSEIVQGFHSGDAREIWVEVCDA